MIEDIWDELLDHERKLIEAQAKPGGWDELPQTGPPEMNTTKEVLNLLARLAVVLQFEQHRVNQMELGNHFSLVHKWVRNTKGEIDSLGVGALAMAKVMKEHGY